MKQKVAILIVDDEYEKVKFISNLMEKELDRIKYEHVSTSKEAIEVLKNTEIDILIIDLQIPETLGDEIDPRGGEKLLEYINSNRSINRPTHILGLTQHQDSYDACKETFQNSGWSLIIGLNDKEYIRSILLAKIRHSIEPPTKYDLAIVTALERIELEAVLSLPCNWIPITSSDDCYIYHSGEITLNSGKSISVIATSCLDMGIAQASAIGMKISLKFSPDFIFMTGIAAGVEGRVKLGDILVVETCWDWGSGKQTIIEGKPAFLSSPNQLSIEPILKGKLKRISATREFLEEIYNSWPSTKPESALNVHIGPVATGAVVLEDPTVLDMIRSQHRKIIGVEMEAYGLMLSASISTTTPPKVIVIKSVCDFADPQKNDDWQSYAAYTSTQFAYKFITGKLY